MSKKRRAEQLIKLAYKLESIANDMKADGGLAAEVADGVRFAATRIDYIGRALHTV
jgi:hypothetical protein